MSLRSRIQRTLERLAGVHGAGDYLAVARAQVAGEPTGWREEITFERGQLQTFLRNRSFADEGGAPVGVWKAPAENWRVQALAAALSGAQIWNLESDSELQPGVEAVDWSIVTSDGVFDIVLKTSAPAMNRLIHADAEMRNIANTLEEQRIGAFVRAGLRAQMMGRSASVQLGFVNDGTQPCILVNPFSAAPSDANYFRVEIAAMPEEKPNVTGYGAQFKPVALELLPLADRAEPWTDPYVMLSPGGRLLLPTAPLVALQLGTWILRGVYSNYGVLGEIGGVPVIRGRAFSNEVVVKA